MMHVPAMSSWKTVVNSSSLRFHVRSEVVNRQRLRATLRLCIRAEQANALAARLEPNEPDPVRALMPIVRLARLSVATNRWIPPFKRAWVSAPLRPHWRLPAIPALTLALHLGLDLDVAALARLFHRSPDEISLSLQQARLAVDPSYNAACPEFAAAVGRYRDPSPDRLGRLKFMQHLEGCERCQLALSRARETDQQLLAATDHAEQGLAGTDDVPRSSRSIWLAPALFGGMVALLAIVVVLAGVTASRRILAGQSAPVPLVAADQPAPRFTGWLLERSQANGVDAINVATGQQRALIPSLPASGSVVYVSANDLRIAVAITGGPPETPGLRIYRMDGTLMHQWPLEDSDHSGNPLGWLDPSHFLLTQDPHRAAGESPAHFRNRLPSIEQLVSLNVNTGARQVLLTGQVFDAHVSPNGHLLAVDFLAASGHGGLEIRPVTANELGDPVATFNGRFFPPAVWTPDSQKIVFFAPTTSDPNVAGSIDSMTVMGKVTELRKLPAYVEFPTNVGPSPTISEPVNYYVLTVSPDGQQVVYGEEGSQAVAYPAVYWVMPLNGGAPRKLESSSEHGTFTAVAEPEWSPDGDSLALTAEQPYFLSHPQQGSSQTSISSVITLAFSANGDPQGALLNEFSGSSPLAWLPEGALPAKAVTEAPPAGTFQTQGAAQDISVTPQLTETSRLSPDGSEALIYDKTYDFSLAAPLNGGQAVIAGAPIDPSWLPDGSAAIGVQHHTNNGRTISRITIYGQGVNGGIAGAGMLPLDFDPAQLGDSSTAAYREPMLAPNGLRYSFFVVDGPVVSLWIGGFRQQPDVVTRWTLPNGAKVDPPLIAAWVDNDTLIFAEPAEWADGLPQHVTLERVALSGSGALTVAPLIGWHARGNEQGIVLQELRVSPGDSQIALRLRHYSGANLTKDRFDSLVVAESSDLTQSVELVRGSSGDGMSWSPDGTELAAVIKGGLQVMSSDGSRVQTVDTGSGVVTCPLWVRPNEIWCESGTGDESQVIIARR